VSPPASRRAISQSVQHYNSIHRSVDRSIHHSAGGLIYCVSNNGRNDTYPLLHAYNHHHHDHDAIIGGSELVPCGVHCRRDGGTYNGQQCSFVIVRLERNVTRHAELLFAANESAAESKRTE